MKSFYLPVAGILCILGYGHTVKIPLPTTCTNAPGYVYFFEDKSPNRFCAYGKLCTVFRVIGASGHHPLERMNFYDVSGVLFFEENSSVPVIHCDSALSSSLAALQNSGFTQLVDEGQYSFIVPPGEFPLFMYMFESEIYDFARIEVPPKEWLQPCTDTFGYVYIVGIRFERDSSGSTSYCIRVFGSSSLLPGDPLNVFEPIIAIKLPFMTVSLKGSNCRYFAVSSCKDALLQVQQRIRQLHLSWEIEYLYGEECYRHIDEKELSMVELSEKVLYFVGDIYGKLFSLAVKPAAGILCRETV